MIISKSTRYFEGQKTIDTPLTVRGKGTLKIPIFIKIQYKLHQSEKWSKMPGHANIEMLFWAENDHVINTFAENFRIMNFFEDEINFEEIKYEKIIRGMNSEDQKF